MVVASRERAWPHAAAGRHPDMMRMTERTDRREFERRTNRVSPAGRLFGDVPARTVEDVA
jgi:hypothetical protein